MAEGNELNMEIAVELLGVAVAEIDCAVNGAGAVEQFETSPPGYYDAILMDVQMPVMDGYTATRKIRAGGHPDAKTIPIIAMTANTFIEDIEDLVPVYHCLLQDGLHLIHQGHVALEPLPDHWERVAHIRKLV